MQCLANSTNYCQRLIWFTNLEDSLNKCRPPEAPYKRLIYEIHIKNEQNDLTLQTDRDRSITTDLHHLSFAAKNTRAKLTNQFILTGLRTFDWQQLFTWHWWWNVSHHYRQQSFSGLHWSGRSQYTFSSYPQVLFAAWDVYLQCSLGGS